MKVVVSDTSPVTNLMHTGRLDILRLLFGEITLSPAVYQELCELSFQRKIIDEQKWIKFEKAEDEQLVTQLLRFLDKGEAESIVVAVEMKADLILIDEKAGRSIAERMGLKVTGLLGVLVEAKKVGIIASVKHLLDQMIQQAGFRIDHKLYQKVINEVGENE